MNLKMIEESYIGTKITVITTSGNKIQGEVLKTGTDYDILKLKTTDGILMINVQGIESIY